jgi:bacillithiol system protein YtxJ
MLWTELTGTEALEDLCLRSSARPQVIFKHSTRCSISTMAKSRLERSRAPETIDFHHLDLLRHRELSTAIADRFAVPHESPQVLLIVNGDCIYAESHNAISMEEISGQIPS